MLRKLDRLRKIRRSRSHDDVQAIAVLERRLRNLLPLRKRKRRKLPGGAQHHYAVRALRLQIRQQILVQLRIKIQVLVARGGNRHPKLHLLARRRRRIRAAALGIVTILPNRLSRYRVSGKCRATSHSQSSRRSHRPQESSSRLHRPLPNFARSLSHSPPNAQSFAAWPNSYLNVPSPVALFLVPVLSD